MLKSHLSFFCPDALTAIQLFKCGGSGSMRPFIWVCATTWPYELRLLWNAEKCEKPSPRCVEPGWGHACIKHSHRKCCNISIGWKRQPFHNQRKVLNVSLELCFREQLPFEPKKPRGLIIKKQNCLQYKTIFNQLVCSAGSYLSYRLDGKCVWTT